MTSRPLLALQGASPERVMQQKEINMTTTNDKEKQAPAFYIFKQEAEGVTTRIGAAFRHKKGNGLNIVIGDSRYVAFPPKSKPETGEGA
jgi:hypothetical protein